jgi:PleD family two-component response regulator
LRKNFSWKRGYDGSCRKIKVLIVDDHQMVRQGLRTFLELLDDISVVGEAEDGRQAVQQAEALAGCCADGSRDAAHGWY